MTSVVSRTATSVNHHPMSTMAIGDNSYYCHHNDNNNNNNQKSTTTTVLPNNRTNGSLTNNNNKNSSSNIDTNAKNNNDHGFMNNTGKPYKNTHALKMFFSKHHSSSRSRTGTNMEKPNIIQPTTPATAAPSRKAADNNNDTRFMYNQHAATLSEETIKNQHDEKMTANDNIKTNDNNSHGQRQQIEVNDYLYTLLFFSHLNIYLLLFIATYTLFFEKCFFL